MLRRKRDRQQPQRALHHQYRQNNDIRPCRGSANTRIKQTAFVISFIIFGAFTSLYNYLAFFLKGEPFHISPANAGLLSFSFALSFFTAPQAGRLSAKYGAMKVLRVLFLIMAFGMLLTLTSNVVTFIVGAVIFTGCFFGCHSIGLSWVSKNATHARGQAVALYLFFYYGS